jgi:hypothetical protein
MTISRGNGDAEDFGGFSVTCVSLATGVSAVI